MVKGVYVKCRNCHKKFWAEIKLGFGLRKKRDARNLLNCILDEARFYFKCPFCKEATILSTEFFSDREPEITQIVENPNYIG